VCDHNLAKKKGKGTCEERKGSGGAEGAAERVRKTDKVTSASIAYAEFSPSMAVATTSV
jgi:hypothetical protein